MKKIFIVAGDHSGDLYAGLLAKKIKELSPDTEIFSAAGANLKENSTQLVNLTQIAVTGITEVFKYLKQILKLFNDTLSAIKKVNPDLVILLDFPDFNLRLAKKLKKENFKIVYFISPQIWAWRKGRIKIIKKYIDKMLVIFKFEEEFYKKHNFKATFVGHPLLEILSNYRNLPDENNLSIPTIAFLPGSREKEIEKHLPVMIETKKLIAKKTPCRFILIKHPQINTELFQPAQESGIELIEKDAYQCLKKSTLAIAASGTVTLELAILNIPTIVIYKLSFLSWFILKLLVKIDFITTTNLIAKKEIFKELIQHKASAENISEQALELLTNNKLYLDKKSQLKNIIQSLKPENALELAAKEILKS